MPCLLCCETSSTWLKLRHYGPPALRYGARLSWVYSPYFPKWLDELQRCFSSYSFLILLRNGQNIAEYEAYWVMGFPTINLWGACFMSIHSVLAGWIAEILSYCFLLILLCNEHILCFGWKEIAEILSCCSLLILLCNEHNIAEYEAYCLISIPKINPCGTCPPFFLAKWYMQIKQLKLLCIQKK